MPKSNPWTRNTHKNGMKLGCQPTLRCVFVANNVIHGPWLGYKNKAHVTAILASRGYLPAAHAQRAY